MSRSDLMRRTARDDEAPTPPTTEPPERPRTDRPGSEPRRLVRPIVVIVAVVAAVAIVYLSAAAGSSDGRRVTTLPGPGTARIAQRTPDTLAGLRRTASLTGRQAIDEIRNLHVASFPLGSAEVAWYDGGRATVWLSTVPAGGASANDLVARMVGEMSDGTSPFTPPTKVGWAKGVWTTKGPGQVHFFFATEDSVWWLSVAPDLGDRALTDLLGVAR